MAFVDHDLHIHSFLSPCAGDASKTQTPGNILLKAEEDGFNTVCLTDHLWDEKVPFAIENPWYTALTLDHIRSSLPLPQSENVNFLFGCESEMDLYFTISLAPEHYDLFDLIIVSTTHLHMHGFTCRGDETAKELAELWCKRFERVLESDLPFQKVGIAHLTSVPDVLPLIDDETFIRLFGKAADRGIGIELNYFWLGLSEQRMETHLRPLRIAKEEGCRFYLGSDAHIQEHFTERKANFTKIAEKLGLDDSDKFSVRP